MTLLADLKGGNVKATCQKLPQVIYSCGGKNNLPETESIEKRCTFCSWIMTERL